MTPTTPTQPAMSAEMTAVDGIITPETIKNTVGHEIAHLNYGPGGFGYKFRNDTYPRLSWIERHLKGKAAKEAGKTFERTFQVDGSDVADLEEAAAKLMLPPNISDEEKAALGRLGDDWLGPREVEARCVPDGDTRARYAFMRAMADKGLIECRYFPTQTPEVAKIKPKEPKWRRAPASPDRQQGGSDAA